MASLVSSSDPRQPKPAATVTTAARTNQHRHIKPPSQSTLPTITTPLKIDSSASLSPKAIIVGSHTITVFPKAVIHPFATLDSTYGSIVIGEGCIVWELATVGSFHQPTVVDIGVRADEKQASSPKTDERTKTILGKNVVVEAGAVVEAFATIDDNCIVETGSRIGSYTSIGVHSRLAPLTVIPTQTVLDPYSVIFHNPINGQQEQRQNVTLLNNEQIRLLHIRGHEQLLRSVHAIAEPKASRR